MGKTTIIALFVLAGFATVLSAAPAPEPMRAATVKHIGASTQPKGCEEFAGFLGARLKSSTRITARDLPVLASASDCIRFMKLTQQVPPSPELAAWILGSDHRLHQVVETILAADSLKRCWEIMDKLRAHDPGGCDEYFELILAIAVVLDDDRPVRLHSQMGPKVLPYKVDPVARYDDLKELYDAGRSKVNYGKLTASELRFVVDLPVPQSEVEWARSHVSGSASGWGGKYSGIRYDTERPNASRYSWDYGDYTLAAIEEKGGICVDQAYFAVITARAHGIPAIYFEGSGKRAGHAWFGFMKGPGDWELDVGRYQDDEYTTGFAIDPQTRAEMTDHDVSYACERSLHSTAFQEAGVYGAMAEVLETADPEGALVCARTARQKVKRYLLPWQIEQRILLARQEHAALVVFFEEMSSTFRKYPDILVESGKRIESALRAAGRIEEADLVAQRMNSNVGDGRDDLQQSLETERIARLAEGDPKKARREMEKLLNDQKDGGAKTVGLISDYLKLTKKIGHTRDAVKFLEGYIDALIKSSDLYLDDRKQLLMLLHKAYINDGDTVNASRVLQRIGELSADEDDESD